MNRVLIAEDSPTQAEKLRLILEDAGMEVAVARDGDEACARLLRDGPFDLVVTDVNMPGRDGYALCREVRLHAGQAVPVILLTSLGDALDIVRGLEAGADNFITKPYDPAHLLERVRTVLGNRRLRAGKLQMGLELEFLGHRFTVTSGKEQILDLLASSLEEIVRANRTLEASRAELARAKAEVDRYARVLEGRVRISEDRHAALVEQAHDAIFVLDLTGRVLEVNRRAIELLGRSRAELVGQDWRGLVPVELHPRTERDLAQAIESGACRGEAELLRGDGERVPVEFTSSVVDLGRDRILQSIVRDVSERRAAEEALRRSEEQLRHAQKMEAVGRLAGGIAHDFNNSLTAIMGFADLAQMGLAPDEPRARHIGQVFRAARRAADLTRQLLAFSRKQVMNPRVLDPGLLLRNLEPMLRRLIGEDVDLVVRTAPDVGRLHADPGQLEQVVANLVVNARDAMPQGGRLVLETRATALGPEYAAAHPTVKPGRYVLLEVSDTGTGMDREVLGRIFEPFFTTKEEGKGTGLGLSIVYGIVQQSGGHVTVYSEPRLGTSFKVYLPRLSDEAPEGQVAPAPALVRGTETVLLVEDDEIVRELARTVLEGHGYTALEASHGEEALATCATHAGPIHLMVSDLVMPRLGGVRLHEQLAPRFPDMRVLFVSGYSEAALGPDRLQGAAFLPKPFSPAELLSAVRSVLDRGS